MATNTKAEKEMKERVPVLRTFARAPISAISRWRELDDGIGVCRIYVIGDPPGPASNPPRITFYVKDGGYPEDGHPLRADEAKRCATALRVGDWVELVGNVGPERDTAERQEVIVTEPVKLRERAPAEYDDEDDADEEAGSSDGVDSADERDGASMGVAA
jgi:hypothetical protein